MFVFLSELGHLLLAVSLLAWAFRPLFRGTRGMVGAVLVGLVFAILPTQFSPRFYTRSLLGDLSALTLVFLMHLLVRSICDVRLIAGRDWFCIAIPGAVTAALLYPASLGVPGYPDLYQTGFASIWLMLAFGILSICLLLRRCPITALWVGSALLMYGLRGNESLNFWDCLIDIPSVIVCLHFLVKTAALAWKKETGPALN